VRASRAEELVLREEVASLVEQRGGRLVELVGSRREVRLDTRALKRLVPDIRTRDLFVCGPEGFSAGVVASARRLAVPEDRIHHETFVL
jgi:ferredoxin-NADP reductase